MTKRKDVPHHVTCNVYYSGHAGHNINEGLQI